MRRAVALVADGHRLSRGKLRDGLGERRPIRGIGPVDGGDRVARLQAGLGCRAAVGHIGDGRGRLRHADAAEQHEHDDEGEHDVHERSGEQHDKALPARQRAVRLRTLGVEQRFGVGDFACLAEGICAHLGRRVDLELVAPARCIYGAPAIKDGKGLFGLVIGDAARQRDVLRIGRAVTVHVGEHLLEVGVLGPRLHPGDAIVAAKRDARDAVAAAVALEADVGARQPDHELGHAHAERARGDEMPELVDNDEHQKDDDAPEYCHDDVHELSSPRKTRGTVRGCGRRSARAARETRLSRSPSAPWRARRRRRSP